MDQGFFGSAGSSTGPPAFFQAPKPPLIWATGLRPMRCAICAASAERMPPAQKKTNFLSSRKDRLEIGTRRIDPELEHAARAMEGAGDLAVALQFADIADIDQHGVIAAGKLDGLLDRQRLDFALGGVDQRLISGRDVCGMACVGVMLAGRAAAQAGGS